MFKFLDILNRVFPLLKEERYAGKYLPVKKISTYIPNAQERVAVGPDAEQYKIPTIPFSEEEKNQLKNAGMLSSVKLPIFAKQLKSSNKEKKILVAGKLEENKYYSKTTVMAVNGTNRKETRKPFLNFDELLNYVANAQ